MYQRVLVLIKVAKPVADQAIALSEMIEADADYQKPAVATAAEFRNNLAAWEARQAASQRKKEDRQRRLIARLRK